MEKQRHHEIPVAVRNAQIRGDREALSSMGRKGAEHGAARRQLDAKIEDSNDKARRKDAELLEEREGRISPEGDVLPPESGNH